MDIPWALSLSPKTVGDDSKKQRLETKKTAMNRILVNYYNSWTSSKGILGGIPGLNHHFGVTSAEVAIIGQIEMKLYLYVRISLPFSNKETCSKVHPSTIINSS